MDLTNIYLITSYTTRANVTRMYGKIYIQGDRWQIVGSEEHGEK